MSNNGLSRLKLRTRDEYDGQNSVYNRWLGLSVMFLGVMSCLGKHTTTKTQHDCVLVVR